MDEAELLADLTEAQKEAVTHGDGPMLVVAGAGSGKTRVITRRVAYLVHRGVAPPSIMAITFTNKAAGEMKQRVAAALERPLRDWGRLDQPFPMICTFHSLCLRILKHYATTIGLKPSFSVFDSADQNKLIKQALESLNLSDSRFTPGGVHSTISKAKNQLLSVSDFTAKARDSYEREVARAYRKYQELLQANDALDFDDLLLRTCSALRSHRDVLEELQDRFLHILIDEYQDTNHAQYILAHALAHKRRNITVVGDPDQSIYAWRGADLANILDFEKDYPDAKIVRLEQNYRSTKTVLAIASKLIANNRRRKEKSLWTDNQQGEKALLLRCGDEHEEARQITDQLQSLHKRHGYPWNAMAIFYRVNSLSRVLEDALRRAGVPYQIARGVEFYNRKEIKDSLAYLRLLVNPSDQVSLERIANVPPRGISDATLRALEADATAAGISLWEAMQRIAHPELMSSAAVSLAARAANSVSLFVQLIEKLRAELPNTGSVKKIMEETYRRSGLEALLKKLDPDQESEVPNVNELISSAAEFDEEHENGSLEEYLSAVSLVSDVDRVEGGQGAVTLMTLHAAKGLEFPVVAIAGLEDGCLPHSRARMDEKEMEEERRLCFVGITRAQERLILSLAARRNIRGSYEYTVPSPFLSEIPGEMVQILEFERDFPQNSDRSYRQGWPGSYRSSSHRRF